MNPLFPPATALQSCFAPSSPFSRRPVFKQSKGPPTLKDDDFPIWSAVDDVKSKAGQLSEEAQKEYSKASATAQAKAGAIELYSGKYYAACTLGGILACVGFGLPDRDASYAHRQQGPHTYQRHAARPGQVPPAGRPEHVQRELRGMGQDRPRRGHPRHLHRLGPNPHRILSQPPPLPPPYLSVARFQLGSSLFSATP